MIPYFPKTIANKGLLLYALSLTAVSMLFMGHAMNLMWIAIGLIEVTLFFMLSNRLVKEWRMASPKTFVKNAFWTAFLLRAVWVIFSYFMYKRMTGLPFEFDPADSIYYYEESEWLRRSNLGEIWYYMITIQNSVSDSGYLIYLALIQKIVGYNIILVRLVKAAIGAWTCVLLYKLSSRMMGEQVGRMVGVMSMLMPNLIIYCGLHLKETEMLLLMVLFLERTDYLMRAKKLDVWNIVLVLFLVAAMFTFRTVLGAVALFSFLTAVLFSPGRIVKKGRRVAIAVWAILAVGVLAGGVVMTEVEELWNGREVQQDNRRNQQMLRGNQWAKYATGTVMAPMIFVMPFSTMVDTGQENQMIMHGGNYVRNFMGVFVLISLFDAIFRKKNWRDFALVGSFAVGYLGIISTTGFANAERFLLPGLPMLIIMWAYGMSVMDAKYYKFVKYWYVVVPIMEIGWAYFKIGSRGLL